MTLASCRAVSPSKTCSSSILDGTFLDCMTSIFAAFVITIMLSNLRSSKYHEGTDDFFDTYMLINRQSMFFFNVNI
jgi:hypothetical protein